MLIKKEIIDGELVLRMILFPVTYCLVKETILTVIISE